MNRLSGVGGDFFAKWHNQISLQQDRDRKLIRSIRGHKPISHELRHGRNIGFTANAHIVHTRSQCISTEMSPHVGTHETVDGWFCLCLWGAVCAWDAQRNEIKTRVRSRSCAAPHLTPTVINLRSIVGRTYTWLLLKAHTQHIPHMKDWSFFSVSRMLMEYAFG